jgi:hypothetical protein
MVACPACTASLQRTNAKPHCEDQDCGWIKCSKCKCVIDYMDGTYFRSGSIWGNEDGYLKTLDA